MSPEAEHGAVPGAPAPARTWNVRLLRQLDWKRFEELTRMILARGGYRAELTEVTGGGEVSLAVYNGSGRSKPAAVVRCPPWAASIVREDALREFAAALGKRGFDHGTYITPGRFSQAAIEYADGYENIELVDGADYLELLDRLPPEELAQLLKLTTAGDFFVPTCPACGAKMECRQTGEPVYASGRKNLHFRKSEAITRKVQCNRLTIARQAEVQFLKEVHAAKITVHGRAIGNFVCNGSVSVSESGAIVGLVAARAVNLEPGGILDGEMKILNAEEIHPVAEDPKETFWGCPNHPACPAILRLREENR